MRNSGPFQDIRLPNCWQEYLKWAVIIHYPIVTDRHAPRKIAKGSWMPSHKDRPVTILPMDSPRSSTLKPSFL